MGQLRNFAEESEDWRERREAFRRNVDTMLDMAVEYLQRSDWRGAFKAYQSAFSMAVDELKAKEGDVEYLLQKVNELQDQVLELMEMLKDKTRTCCPEQQIGLYLEDLPDMLVDEYEFFWWVN